MTTNQPIAPEAGSKPGGRSVASPQYPFAPLPLRRVPITNTAALQAAGIRASFAGLAPPAEPVDLSAAGARFVLGPLDPCPHVGLVFALGRADGGDPNNRMAQFRIRGYTELRHRLSRQWSAEVLLDGYVVAGDAAVHAGSLMVPAGATEGAMPAGYDVNWADTIGVNNDYTLGGSARVVGAAADARAMLVFDFHSCPYIEVEMTCLTDGSHGTAAALATGAYRLL